MASRLLVFDGPKASVRFELLRAALLAGGDGKGDRSAGTIRREARMLSLLDDVSEAVNGDQDTRVLMEGEHTVQLSAEDFTLLSEYADKCPWTPRASRAAVDLWDWLAAAEKRDS